MLPVYLNYSGLHLFTFPKISYYAKQSMPATPHGPQVPGKMYYNQNVSRLSFLSISINVKSIEEELGH